MSWAGDDDNSEYPRMWRNPTVTKSRYLDHCLLACLHNESLLFSTVQIATTDPLITMFGSLRSPLSSLIASSSSSSFASTSRHAVQPILRRLPPTQPVQVRYRNLLAPRRWKYRKSRKGFPITVRIEPHV